MLNQAETTCESGFVRKGYFYEITEHEDQGKMVFKFEVFFQRRGGRIKLTHRKTFENKEEGMNFIRSLMN